MKLAVRATPRGGRDAIDGWSADAGGRPVLKLRIAAAAADGAANAAVLALLARSLDRPKSGLRILSGQTARQKLIEIDDVDQADLDRAFGRP